MLVAYFSMEFGIHERLPIYSGGLGVLAGDHLKAAAELGVPLVGVGLLYTGGYFRQGVDKSGRQTEDYQPVDPDGGRPRPRGRLRHRRPRRHDDRGRGLAQGRRLGRRGRPALPARGRLAHGRALRRRPRAPDPPGAAARRRRRPRARRARDRAERLPPERGALGVPAARAAAHTDCGRRRNGRSARADPPLLRLHHAHARPGRQRGLRREARAPVRRRARGGGRARARSGCSSSVASARSRASA